MESNKLYAIWKRDTFPYFIGSEVVELKENGLVSADGFPGYSFKYLKIYPISEGQKLHESAKQIAKEAEEQIDAIRSKALSDINKIMGIDD